jgi:hypothetical protein
LKGQQEADDHVRDRESDKEESKGRNDDSVSSRQNSPIIKNKTKLTSIATSAVSASAVAASAAAALEDHNPMEQGTSTSKKKSRSKSRRPSYFNASHDPDEVFEKDVDMINLRSHIEATFVEEFAKGVSKYISGDWPTSKTHLELCDTMMRESPLIDSCIGDGPSQTLLKYMASYEYKAPSSWMGFRPLTSK